MKLRIRGNSIRLRLRKSEVQQLLDQHCVEEKTHFASGTLIYQLLIDQRAISPISCFSGGTISIALPPAIAEKWTHSSQVSIATTQELDNGQSLRILIEKDFQCLNPRDDDSDAYPNPENHQAC